MAEDLDVPFRRIQQTEQQLDRRGFSRAVWPEQPKHFAAPHLEIHLVHRARLRPAPEILEDFRQPANGDDDFGGLFISDFGFWNWYSGSHLRTRFFGLFAK